MANCEFYDQTKSTPECLRCKYPFFVSAAKCETERTVSKTIYYCKTLSSSADTCDACHDGYKLTNDKKKCLPNVLFCLTHASATSTDTALSCDVCIDGFYKITQNSKGLCV